MGEIKGVNELFETIKKKIELEGEEAGFVEHPGENGETREGSITEFVKSLLPKSFQYGAGKIVNSFGQKSFQQDIIMYSPYVSILTEKSKLFPIDAVFSTIEVKSFLNKVELEKAMKNIVSVKKIRKGVSNDRKIICNIFAYSGDSNETLLKNINTLKQKLELSNDEMFDNICINGRTLITSNNRLKSMSSQSNSFDYLCMDLEQRALPYFLDSIVSSIEMPKKMLPIFINYLGTFEMGVEEWKLE